MQKLYHTFYSLFKEETENEGWEIVDGDNNEFLMTLEATVAGDAQEQQQQEAEFVVVVDRSGSMQGTPWRQVQQALIKMLELTQSDEKIKVRALAYSYDSAFLTLSGDAKMDKRTIEEIRATGSTNFVAVFQDLGKIFKGEAEEKPQKKRLSFMKKTKASVNDESKPKQNPSKSYFIFFMTDGEDTCNNEKALMAAKEKLQTEIECSGAQAMVHVLGFSDSHDEQFLESLTYLGTSDGTYSFVSPKEGEKALEENILALIKTVSSFVGRNVNIEVTGENMEFLGDKPGETKTEVVLPAVMSKQEDGNIKISTKKFVKMPNGSEPKVTLKLHESKSNDDEGKPATLKSFEFVTIANEEEIVNHNLIKMRTSMNQLMKDEDNESGENKEDVKKKYEAIERSFKKLSIGEGVSKATTRRKDAVENGIRLLKEIHDPSYVSTKYNHI